MLEELKNFIQDATIVEIAAFVVFMTLAVPLLIFGIYCTIKFAGESPMGIQ